MTKKDFKIFAEEFGRTHQYFIGGSLTVQQKIMLEGFFNACKKINPKFDEEVWMDYFWKEVFP
tara:strand:+ start:379 stop:567 length:189 start_codon:yes stop_codon:yes gene_type:complete